VGACTFMSQDRRSRAAWTCHPWRAGRCPAKTEAHPQSSPSSHPGSTVQESQNRNALAQPVLCLGVGVKRTETERDAAFSANLVMNLLQEAFEGLIQMSSGFCGSMAAFVTIQQMRGSTGSSVHGRVAVPYLGFPGILWSKRTPFTPEASPSFLPRGLCEPRP